MARNIRWYMLFKSYNNVDCRINIYHNDWPEGLTNQITGAADPFYFEEDISEDLLNGVVRYRTGYIRIVELYSFDFLSDIYPSAPFDRYVEVLYGGTVVFNGYIQVQNFESELVPVPRILEIPVISPLGLFEKRTFSNTSFMPPSAVSLGGLLDVMLANSSYSYVYLPKNYGYPNTVGLWMQVSTLVATPWNEDYSHSDTVNTMTKVMKGESYYKIVESICKAFGWICHDTPTALVFTAFDYEGDYCYYPVGHIGVVSYQSDAGIPSAAADITTYLTPADKSANMQTIQPDTGIEISYKGDPQSRVFSFDRTYTDSVQIMPSFVPVQDLYPDHAEKFSICNLVPVPNLWEMSGLSALTFDSSDKINIGQGCVAWNGREGILISISGAYQDGHELFWVRYYMRKRTGQKYSLSYDAMYRDDGYIGGLKSDDEIKNNITTAVAITDYYVQITFKYHYGGTSIPQLPAQALIFIYNITLDVMEDSLPYAKYRYPITQDKDTIPATGNPAISSSVEMPISLYRLNDHLIGSAVRSSKLTTYPYLFQPRKKLTSKFRVASTLTFPHVRLFSYLGKKWRIIAQTFRPWNDEYELTMQGSETL